MEGGDGRTDGWTDGAKEVGPVDKSRSKNLCVTKRFLNVRNGKSTERTFFAFRRQRCFRIQSVRVRPVSRVTVPDSASFRTRQPMAPDGSGHVLGAGQETAVVIN